MTLAFGIAFLLPVVMVALTVVDLVQWQTWLKQWRIAVVVAFVFAAVATPTGDIGTLCGLGLPICGIYFLAILVCYLYCQAQMLKIWFLLQRDTWTIRCHSVIQHIQYVYERAAIYIPDFLKRKGK
jgi:Sec-independent protein secretion pathway component TatC